jgi:modification methylase
MVQGPERLRNAEGKPLHPCQKPLLFSRRMIEASTRPGDLAFEPFGGTCRAAFACEELGDRHYVCSEMNPEYVDAVVPLLPKERSFDGKQRLLFGRG